jgi:hypothetical protein
MGYSAARKNSAAIGNAIDARWRVEAERIESFSLDAVDALRKSVRKLRWIGLEEEAQTIERLIVHGRRDGRRTRWSSETD